MARRSARMWRIARSVDHLDLVVAIELLNDVIQALATAFEHLGLEGVIAVDIGEGRAFVLFQAASLHGSGVRIRQ
jgi:hypothetical protein